MARRWTTVALVLLLLVDLGLVSVLLTRHYGGSRATPSVTATRRSDNTSTPTTTATPATARTSESSKAGKLASKGHLVLDSTTLVAASFRPVAITGRWTDSPASAHPTVRVELLQGHRWSAFPLPAVVTRSGRFTAYAALGPRGQYRLRVVGSGGKPASDPVVVTVR